MLRKPNYASPEYVTTNTPGHPYKDLRSTKEIITKHKFDLFETWSLLSVLLKIISLFYEKKHHSNTSSPFFFIALSN